MALTRVRFNEQQSGCTIEGDIVDIDGAAIPAASLTAAQLTLYDMDTYVSGGSPSTGILNDRDAQDILNAHDVTIDTDGHFIWSLQPEDNAIVTERRQVERHRALFVFTWADGAFPFEVEIEVVNLRTVS